MTHRLFSRCRRTFGHPPHCLSILPLTSFFNCTTKDWLMPTKAATLRVKTLFLSCTKAWCLCSWDNRGIQTILKIAPHVLWNQGYTMHKKSHDVLNYTMHTKMPMLEEWRWTKVSTVNLTTLTFPILDTLFPFHLLVSHLCNWSLGLLLWSLDHFIYDLNRLTMGDEVEYVQSVLSFVCNCVML